jgi:hypothetical protein
MSELISEKVDGVKRVIILQAFQITIFEIQMIMVFIKDLLNIGSSKSDKIKTNTFMEINEMISSIIDFLNNMGYFFI